MCGSVSQSVAVCFSVLQCVAVCRSVLQCVIVRCRVLQCVAECCSMLQCVTILDWLLTIAHGVATVSRIDKIIGLFCRISSLL